MPRVELPAGPVDYVDTGGDGPVLVLTHGLPMDGRQWREVLPLLAGYRCVLPTLPLGAHRAPMRPDADLSQQGVARILADFLDALDLRDVTLVLNDWGGGQFVITEGRAERVARLVLVACEAFDNFPPGTAKQLSKAMRLPGAAWLMFQAHRFRWVRRAPGGYRAMCERGIPDDLLAEWFTPARVDAAVRRDFVKFSLGAPDDPTLLALFEQMRAFDRPVLVVWADKDHFMPREHGPRLAALYPDARLVEVADSGTLIPFDQPATLAAELRGFLAATGAAPGRTGGER